MLPWLTAKASPADDIEVGFKQEKEFCEQMVAANNEYFSEAAKANLRTGYERAIRAYKPYVESLKACQKAKEDNIVRLRKIFGRNDKYYLNLKRTVELDRVIYKLRLKVANAEQQAILYMATLHPGPDLTIQPEEYKEHLRLVHLYIAASDELQAVQEMQKNERRRLAYELKEMAKKIK